MEEVKTKISEMISEWNEFLNWDDTTICETLQGLAHWSGRILNYISKEKRKVFQLKSSLDKLKAKIHFKCKMDTDFKYTKDDIVMEYYSNDEYNDLTEKLESAQTSLSHFENMLNISTELNYHIKSYLEQKKRIGI